MITGGLLVVTAAYGAGILLAVYSGWLPEDGATHSRLEGASFAQDVEQETRA